MAFGAFTGSLIPSRSPLETSRLLLDPDGGREMSIAEAVAIHASAKVLKVALPVLLKAVLPPRVREPLLPRVLRGAGDVAALLRNIRGDTTPDREWLLQHGHHYPRAIVTHPETQKLLGMLRREAFSLLMKNLMNHRKAVRGYRGLTMK